MEKITITEHGRGIFGIGGVGIAQANEMPVIPTLAQVERVQRLERNARHCQRCGASDLIDGAMFSTDPASGLCDDCLDH